MPQIVGTTVTPDGRPAYMMDDGSVVLTDQGPQGPNTAQRLGQAGSGLAGAYNMSSLFGGGGGGAASTMPAAEAAVMGTPATPVLVGGGTANGTLATGGTMYGNTMAPAASAGTGLGATVAPIAGALYAPEMAVQSWEGANKIAKGKKTSAREELALNAANMAMLGLPQLYNHGIRKWVGTGKGADQVTRDEIRNVQESLMPGYWQDRGSGLISTGDGVFDTRQVPQKSYNIDWSQPINEQALGSVNPLAFYSAYQSGMKDKIGKFMPQIAGEMYNAASGSSDPIQTSKQFWSFMKDGGTTRDEIYGAVLDATDRGWLDKDVSMALRAAIDSEYGVVNPNKGKGGEAEYGDKRYLPEGK